MHALRRTALVALMAAAASCARREEAPPAPAANGAWPPPEAEPAAFIPDHLQGDWVVYAHRVVGESPVSEDMAVSFRGRPVTFTRDYVAFGADTCRQPVYRSAMLRADSVLATDYGASPSQFGFVGGPTAIVTRTEVWCDGQRWASPPGLVLDMPDGRVYLLWDGTYFQLERR